jgi:plastocyanin
MKKAAAFLALALAAAALVACGDDNGDNGVVPTEPETNGEAVQENGQAAGTIKFVAESDGSFAYTEEDVTATAGKSTIEFDNPSSVPHDVVIEDEGGETVGQTEIITSDTDSAEVDLEAGTYTFYCSVPGHREGGMEGTLTVE